MRIQRYTLNNIWVNPLGILCLNATSNIVLCFTISSGYVSLLVQVMFQY